MKLVSIQNVLSKDTNLAEKYKNRYPSTLSSNLIAAGRRRRQNAFFNHDDKTYVETTLKNHNQRTIAIYEQKNDNITQREYYIDSFSQEVKELANKIKEIYNKTAKEEHKIPDAPDAPDVDNIDW